MSRSRVNKTQTSTMVSWLRFDREIISSTINFKFQYYLKFLFINIIIIIFEILNVVGLISSNSSINYNIIKIT